MSFRTPLLLALGAGILLTTGCATKRDVRDLQAEIRTQSQRQEEANRQLAAATRDSLRVQSQSLFELRGQIMNQLLTMQEQLVTLQELTGQNQRTVAGLREELESARTRLLTPTPSVDDPEGMPGVTVGSGEAEDLYNMAVTMYNRGTVATARRGFEQFLTQFPNHALAADARYYLADIMVQEDRWEEAVEAFGQIPTLYPASPRVPDALYRMGLAYVHLERVPEAREALQRVVTSYAGTGVAILAREALADLPPR